MAFLGLLVLINVGSFLPLYLLNVRESPNPFEFLLVNDKTVLRSRLRSVYAKPECTDPFHLNFDFTFLVLLAVAFRADGRWLVWGATILLAFGFIEILYSAVMQVIFKRPPQLAADLLLLKAGLSLAQRRLYALAVVVAVLLATILGAAYFAVWLLLRMEPPDARVLLATALLLAPLCLYHWRLYDHGYYLGRTVYSPLLHLWRNVEHGKRLDVVLAKDPAHFESRNYFKGVTLAHRPTIVVICVESYGSVVYRDPDHSAAIGELLGDHERRLREAGYYFASTHSAAPIFAGGSWLSYASLTYGIEFTEMQLFDALFAAGSPFGAYESLFHVLKRNGYRNVLLCPLGGVDVRNVDWGRIDRCFQSDLDITFDSLGYRGPLVNYFGIVRLYSPLDQYSLSYAYERASRERSGPFSLFFCTLNSHYPWEAVGEVVADWRSLDDPAAPLHAFSGIAPERYRASIRYQLDYVLRFVRERADDDVVFVIFGDHQPPMITEKRMGKQTPVHVIGRDPKLVNVFLEHGFAARLDLTGAEPPPIKHHGFLSLFLKGMQAAYGAAGVPVDYREHGVELFDEPTAGAGARNYGNGQRAHR
jgi:hypothetical protein